MTIKGSPKRGKERLPGQRQVGGKLFIPAFAILRKGGDPRYLGKERQIFEIGLGFLGISLKNYLLSKGGKENEV